MPNIAPASNYTYKVFEDLTLFIEGQMGGNMIDVELTTDDYTNAFNKAKAVWFQRGNVNLNETYTMVQVLANQTVYDLSGGNAAIDTILTLIKPTSNFYTQNPFNLAVLNDLLSGILSQELADVYTFVGTLQFIDTINMLFVRDPMFVWNRRTQSLTLLKPPLTNETWFIHGYTYPPDVDLYNNVWVQDWMLAECKHFLGLAYQKYSTIVGPAGDIQLDGAALIEEAKEAKKQLLDDILDFTDGDEIGGYIGII